MEPRTTHEWLYRANTSKEGLEVTRSLLENYGFIVRSAYAEGDKEQMIASVAQIAFGDVIHLYFAGAGGGVPLGAYRIVGPNNHPRPELFASGVKGALTLRTVAPGELDDHLRENKGYAPDPRLAAFCGWPVVPDEHPSPIYSPSRFPGRSTIAPYPAPPRRRRA